MKKRLLPLLIISVLFVAKANAQYCIPDVNFNTEGYSPDTTANLDTAFASVYYQDVITINAPVDTLVSGVTATIDSLVITGVTGLPASITYQCNNNRCKILGGAKGCIQFVGTPLLSDVGTYNLIINVSLSVKVFAQPFTYPSYAKTGYKLIVAAPNGIEDQQRMGARLFPNSPNPFSQSTAIRYYSESSDNYEFSVYDAYGKKVATEMLKANSGDNTYQFVSKGLSEGLYFYTLKNDRGAITQKMMIIK
ncbi:MAG: T9SS type A sorting domain-containing protein [Bacteroidota bacterium]